MRVVVIGATGHVGTHLVPRLVTAGHEVVALSRGTREPYQPHEAWARVRRVQVDRDAEDAAGTFGGRVADLRPDAVVDMVCFTPASAGQLVEALRGRVGHLLHAGTIWTHGRAAAAPLREEDPREPFGDYGVQKAACEDLLLAESRRGGVPTTVLHPGHISGPGWPVINPLGNTDPAVWPALAAGEELDVPDGGHQLMHHVHADDVAQAFQRALEHRSAAVGESFFAVSDRGWTARGLAEQVASWFGQEARLRSVGWEEFRAGYQRRRGEQEGAEHAGASWEHLVRNHSASPAKAGRLLGYAPRWTSPQVLRESLVWLSSHGRVDLGGRVLPCA
ncbi:NAD-dependent epimerase/dehydratase family protein [Quadrisphaera sp. KR29]|uniref:NAD-dependent epimerase/dehydratase family protein n=1 Tax=Quadrisphaera sp. KR29 TaxID=3461391 RepID=UPI0040448646